MSKDSFSPTEILTLEELCSRLKVRPSWVYAQTRQDGSLSIPFIKVGQMLRFRWPAIEAWLETRSHGGPAPARADRAGKRRAA
jgi:hypothetical protein